MNQTDLHQKTNRDVLIETIEQLDESNDIDVIVQIPPMHFFFIPCKIILDKVFGDKSVCHLRLTSCLDSAFWLVCMRVISVERYDRYPIANDFFKCLRMQSIA